MNGREAITAMAAGTTTVAAGVTGAAGNSEINEPSPGRDGQYKMIEVDGLNIFYREAGKQGSPKVLLLHMPMHPHGLR